MKKRILSAVMAFAMAASLAACGGASATATTAAPSAASSAAGTTADGGNAETTAAATEAVAETTAAAAAAAGKDAKDVKIGIVTDVGGVNDGSFNQSAWEGLQRAMKDLGIQGSYYESKTDADYAPNIENFIDEDYDMIICIGYALADALKEEATANPDVKFAIVDDASNAGLPNAT